MKLSFTTLPCEGWSVEQLIACCRACGFAGIELKEGPQYALSLSTGEEELRQAAEQFRAAGIAVTNIGSRAIFNGVREEEEQVFQELLQCIRMAQLLGARGVRIMLGTYLRYRNEPPRPLDRDKTISRIRQACDYAADRQVEIWIESHNEFSTGKALRELLDQVDRANCRVIYDIIHPYEFGESPEDTIRLLGSACAHVHIKDGVPFEDQQIHEWKYTMTGEGQLPLASILAALGSSGYDGYCSLEWEPMWRPELRELNIPLDTVFQSYAELMNRLIPAKG